MPQLAGSLTYTEEFDYEVVHRKGPSHGNADGLTRIGPNKPKRTATISRVAIPKNLRPMKQF